MSGKEEKQKWKQKFEAKAGEDLCANPGDQTPGSWVTKGHVGLGGPALGKFRALLLGRRGHWKGLSLDGAPARPWRPAPLGQLGTLTLPWAAPHPPWPDPLGPGFCLLFSVSCVRVWPWEAPLVPCLASHPTERAQQLSDCVPLLFPILPCSADLETQAGPLPAHGHQADCGCCWGPEWEVRGRGGGWLPLLIVLCSKRESTWTSPVVQWLPKLGAWVRSLIGTQIPHAAWHGQEKHTRGSCLVEMVILSKSDKDRYQMTSFTCGVLKNHTNGLTDSHKQTHRHRKQTYGYHRGREGEG